ncbi:VENN motif pre-toxin domain-containing protein, partial [Pseudomonas citronellolis]|uniref:VENN motif pre-toxin domain-containing protein n=1 Tax=Pseudomonas citronellolis TaxID=53408 RepID=UPI0023E35219
TQGEINATEEARKELKAQGKDNPTQKELEASAAYQKVMREYGTGSDLQRAAQAVTAALQYLAGGDIGGAVAGASAPYVAKLIKDQAGNNDTVRIMAQAVLGAVVASAQGNSAAAGAAGATTGELIAASLYPSKKPEELTENERQIVSSLSSLAAGMAGGIVSGDSAGALAAAGAGKNAVDNNAISEIAEEQFTGVSQTEKYEKALAQLKQADEEYKAQNCIGISADACSAKMKADRAEMLKGTASLGIDFLPVIGDIKSFSEANSSLEYLAAIIGLVPALGDVAGTTLKAAEKSLKAGNLEQASELIKIASSQVERSKALDVDSYKNLKGREVVGDGLDHDHIPSFAALRKAKENEIGRPLTEAEAKALYQNSTAVEVPKDVHVAGPTYGGKNTSAQVHQDALDLCGAVCRDTDALRSNMIERGYDPGQVEDAIKQIIDRNRQTGVIK